MHQRRLFPKKIRINENWISAKRPSPSVFSEELTLSRLPKCELSRFGGGATESIWKLARKCFCAFRNSTNIQLSVHIPKLGPEIKVGTLLAPLPRGRSKSRENFQRGPTIWSPPIVWNKQPPFVFCFIYAG